MIRQHPCSETREVCLGSGAAEVERDTVRNVVQVILLGSPARALTLGSEDAATKSPV